MNALSIKVPKFDDDAVFCYNCDRCVNDGDPFCDETCEADYEDAVKNGEIVADYHCEDCGSYMNPREGEWSRICNACDFSEDQWETEYTLTPAQAYRYMFPYTKPTPHDKDTAVAACSEFVDTVNKCTNHMDKCFHVKFLFNYLADHGKILFAYPSFCDSVEGKMKEMEKTEATMDFYNLQPVFVRLRAMIASSQKQD